MFTILVEPSLDTDFTNSDLVMRHIECGGGKITRRDEECRYYKYWGLTCRRCSSEIYVYIGDTGSINIAATVVDGETRSFRDIKSGLNGEATVIVTRVPNKKDV